MIIDKLVTGICRHGLSGEDWIGRLTQLLLRQQGRARVLPVRSFLAISAQCQWHWKPNVERACKPPMLELSIPARHPRRKSRRGTFLRRNWWGWYMQMRPRGCQCWEFRNWNGALEYLVRGNNLSQGLVCGGLRMALVSVDVIWSGMWRSWSWGKDVAWYPYVPTVSKGVWDKDAHKTYTRTGTPISRIHRQGLLSFCGHETFLKIRSK